jgi:transposase
MRATTLLSRVLGLPHTRVTAVEFTDTSLVLDVEPTTRIPRCSGCGCRIRKLYDRRPRAWRDLDLAGLELHLRYQLRRVECRRCGIVVEMVPWAQSPSGFTTRFEEATAHLAQRTDQTTVKTLMRVAWRTVGRIIARVTERLGSADPLADLTHVGIDELSYRRHHEYVTVVINHLTGRVIWAAPGKNAETLPRFFSDLGPERCAKLEAITIDMSGAYQKAVREAAPQATIIFDRFHVQRLVHDALDEVRRAQMREVRGTDCAKAIKRTRFALQKNPWNLTTTEKQRLADVQRVNQPLYRAYLLKESFAAILDRRQVHVAQEKLEEWIAWATRSRLAPFVKVARTIRRHLDGILAYVSTGLNNGRSEGLNGKIRTLTRRAFGFHDASSLIGFIFLCCTGLNLSPGHRTPA